MKHVLYAICTTVLFCANIAVSQAQEESSEQVSKRYHEAGMADAQALGQKFLEDEKPKYQWAYETYLADLEIIRVTGVAADDENLYDDLRKMDSDEFYIYSESERGIEQFRGNAF